MTAKPATPRYNAPSFTDAECATINAIAGSNGFDAAAAVQDYPRLEAEHAELVAALRNVMAGFVGDRGAHNLLGTEAGKHADEARALLAKLGEGA